MGEYSQWENTANSISVIAIWSAWHFKILIYFILPFSLRSLLRTNSDLQPQPGKRRTSSSREAHTGIKGMKNKIKDIQSRIIWIST